MGTAELNLALPCPSPGQTAHSQAPALERFTQRRKHFQCRTQGGRKTAWSLYSLEMGLAGVKPSLGHHGLGEPGEVSSPGRPSLFPLWVFT